MNELISTFDKQRKSLIQFSDASSGNTSNVKSKISVRVKIFLLRSIITSIVSVVNTMSAFSHSYLARILESTLPAHQLATLPGISALLVEIDSGIEEVISCVKPRLAIPIIVSVTAAITDCGHMTALAFVRQLSTLFRRLDRSEVVAHLGDLCSMCVLCLDYRREYGDGSAESEQVETAAVEAAVELSVKLTESELKAFLASLEGWQNVPKNEGEDEDDEQEQESDRSKSHSRGVCFYHYMSVLGDKLKTIFTPLMAPFWDHSAEELVSFAATVTTLHESIVASQPPTKRSKKNKSVDGNTRSESAVYAEVAVSSTISEFKAEIKYLLESVALTCLHDNDGFIDDVSNFTNIVLLRMMTYSLDLIFYAF